MNNPKSVFKEDVPSVETLVDLPSAPSPTSRLEGALAAYLDHEITPAKATPQLIWSCFMTVWVGIVTWEASLIWCGAQTSVALNISESRPMCADLALFDTGEARCSLRTHWVVYHQEKRPNSNMRIGKRSSASCRSSSGRSPLTVWRRRSVPSGEHGSYSPASYRQCAWCPPHFRRGRVA